tara:strand:- start:508 stop:1311 length:804 start_codon:yes stop_codon:yes gene_type:complete
MLWIIQENLHNKYKYPEFLSAIERIGVDHILVNPLPFTDTLVDEDTIEIDDTKPIIISGAVSLGRVARRRGWKPGCFTEKDFEFEIWRDGYGKHNCLNGLATVCTIGDAPQIKSEMFVRPLADNKAFNGEVMSVEQYQSWIGWYTNVPPTDEFQLLHKNTPILVSNPTNIYSEYRFFVVAGSIITASQYKLGQRVVYSSDVDNEAYEFVEKMIGRYTPAIAYVLDIAKTANGCKIIEVNSINSSGFYAADVQKIIMAIEELTPLYQK